MGVQERREREKQARQEAIVEAAQKVFFSKGLDQATVDDVAEAAELSKGTIYLYFTSKEELYLSVFIKGLDILSTQFRDLLQNMEGKSADELMRTFRDVYYEFYMKYPEYFYINSLLYHGRIKAKIAPVIWALTHQKTKECLLVFADIIQKGMDDGLFRAVDSWKTANGVWGAATGIMMLLNDEEHQQFINIPVKDLLDYTIDMLIGDLTQ